MSEHLGLRERKKEATRRLLMRVAIEMFEERGFDNVSVAEIAAAAEVSKMTVFNYFPVKEDLVVGAGEHHIDEIAEVVHARGSGETPHGAMHRHFLNGLSERQPITGLCDDPLVLRVHRLVRDTPALAIRWHDFHRRMHHSLAEVLRKEGASDLSAHLITVQILGYQHALSRINTKRVLDGETADEVYPDAVTAANHAFRLIDEGLGGLLRKPSEHTEGP